MIVDGMVFNPAKIKYARIYWNFGNYWLEVNFTDETHYQKKYENQEHANAVLTVIDKSMENQK